MKRHRPAAPLCRRLLGLQPGGRQQGGCAEVAFCRREPRTPCTLRLLCLPRRAQRPLTSLTSRRPMPPRREQGATARLLR